MTGFYEEWLGADPRKPEGAVGIATGIVKENWDEKHQGMVKVEYFLGETGKNITGWVPVMNAYCGSGFGLYFLPEIGAQVVIGFEQGDRNCPIVIGTVWSQKNKVPDKTADKDNTKKLIKTKGGSQILFSEEKGKERIEISTPAGLTFLLDDENSQILVQDKEKKNQIKLDGKAGAVSLNGEKKVSLCVGGSELVTAEKNKVTVKAGTVSVTADQSLTLKGQSLKGQGTTLELKGDSSAKVESSGVLQVKGTMVKIN